MVMWGRGWWGVWGVGRGGDGGDVGEGMVEGCGVWGKGGWW